MKTKKTALAALLCAVLLLSACGAEPAQSSAPAAGESAVSAAPASEAAGETAAAPVVSFTTQDLDGNAVDQSIFAGHKLTMVNVWATYCSYCLQEMPGLEQLSKAYADKGLQIVGVVADAQADSSGYVDDNWLGEAKSVAAQTGVSYPQLLPTQSLADALLGDFSGGTPTTIFFDESGKQLGEAYVGARSESQWTKIVDALLAQEAGA